MVRIRTIALGALTLALVAPAAALAQQPPEAAAAPRITRRPRLTRFVEAPWPVDAPLRPDGAVVVLRLTLSATGVVDDATVTTSGGADFDAAALAAARQFVFEPAEVDGRPRPIQLAYRYRFTVRVEPPPPPPPPSPDEIVRNRTIAPEAPPPPPPPTPAAPVAAPPEYGLVLTGAQTRRQVVSTEVSADQARRIPGTQGDVLRVVENLPGVGRASVGAGQLVVWGAAPEDTRVLLDGVPVPRLYHDGGLRSVVPGDLIASVELAPGGYDARYGRGLGGLVSATTRPLDGDGVHGVVSADLYDAAATVRANLGRGVRASVGARRSHLDALLTGATADQVSTLLPVPHYLDGQARVAWQRSRDERDEITRAVTSPDPARAALETRALGFERVWGRWRRELADGATLTVTPWVGHDASATVNRVGLVETALDRDAVSGGVRAQWRGRVASWITVETGLDLEVTRADLGRRGSIGAPSREGDVRAFGQNPPDAVNADRWSATTVGIAPYAQADVSLLRGRLHIVPGLRIDPYVQTVSRRTPLVGDLPAVGLMQQTVTVEPRLALRWTPTPRVTVKAAVGRYGQFPQAEDLSAAFGTPALGIARATQTLAGVAVQATRTTSVEVTGFATWSEGLVARQSAESPRVAEALAATGEGRAYGAQVLVRQALWHGLMGWLSYSLIRSERRAIADAPWRLFDYDQTHVLTALVTWDLGRGFEVGVRALRDGHAPHAGDGRVVRRAARPLAAHLRRAEQRAHPRLRAGRRAGFEALRARPHAARRVARGAERDRPRQPRRGRVEQQLLAAGLHHRPPRAARAGGPMDLLRLALCATLIAACAPTLDDPASRVTARRVLAVRLEPAEAAPGEAVRAIALVADPTGDGADAAVRWSWCEARRPLTELGPVAPRCLVDGPWQRAVGDGARVDATLPMNACSVFGPDPPDTQQGESARPVDPDATGGYSAPLRVSVDGVAALGFARLRCGLAGVTRAQAADFTRRYRRNENPVIEAVERVEGGVAAVVSEGPEAPPLSVRAGATVTLRVRWPACAAEACGGAERYVLFDPVTRSLVERGEAMRVSWYTTDGSFREVRTGRGRDDVARETDNVFTAPARAGDVRVWIVLRDERGGVAWRALRLRVG